MLKAAGPLASATASLGTRFIVQNAIGVATAPINAVGSIVSI
jgi:hypothetical protein